MMMIEDFKKDVNNSLKEIPEKTGKQVEALKEKTHTHTHTHKALEELQESLKEKTYTHKALEELQEDTIKQVKEMNKTIQDLKMGIETIKNAQRETTVELENIGKRLGVIDALITKRIQ
jgi:chromosome segregation ATPase